MNQLFVMLLPQALSLGLLAVVLGLWKRKEEARRGRHPLKEKVLRSPGESLRSKLEHLNEQVTDRVMLICLLGAASGLVLQPQVTGGQTGAFPLVWPAVLLAFVAIIWLWALSGLLLLSREQAAHRLGLAGERVVGETLNELLRDGCYVFHDFPADPKWNIDHIVMAPSGVYAVETKARRKHAVPKPNAKDYEIVYDGERLLFPTGEHGDALEQARSNAQWLSAWLSKSTGDPVVVEPILTFPGWWVTRRGNGAVRVLNPKEIRTVVLDRKRPTLDPKLIDRVVFQLDQKCRDVAFCSSANGWISTGPRACAWRHEAESGTLKHTAWNFLWLACRVHFSPTEARKSLTCAASATASRPASTSNLRLKHLQLVLSLGIDGRTVPHSRHS